jgi:hypothetical protein
LKYRETEGSNVKQLGINMSVANLEAFALQQGITKAFDKMSQGEQTLLRYQYLMQATADAQGDFARTSDGYANGLRLLESNIDSIKTRLGQVLVPVLASATSSLNDFLKSITQERPQTVLDTFAQIDLDTESKLAKLKETTTEAHALIGVLGELDNTDASGALRNIANGANVLDSSAPGTWRGLLNAVKDSTGIKNFGTNASGAAIGIDDLASALAGASDSMDQATAWDTLLATLSANAGELTALTGEDEDTTREWLQGLADSANALESGKAGDWNTLLSSLVAGLPGLGNTEAGKAFFDGMAQNFLAMGSESEQAKAGLTALGWSTEQIESKQAQWLETCKRLVQTIPGLNEIINTQTGEVKGGIPAIESYVSAWENGQRRITLIQAQEQRRRALQEKFTELPGLEIDMGIAENRLREQRAKLDALRKKYGFSGDGYETIVKLNAAGRAAPLTAEEQEWNAEISRMGQLTAEAGKVREEYERQKEAYNEGLEVIKEGDKYIEETTADTDALAASTENAATSVRKFGDAEAEAAQTAVKNAESALKSLKDYMDKAYQSTYSSVTSALGGFSKMVTPAEQARQKVKDVQKEIAELQKAGKSTTELQLKMTGYDEAVPTIARISEGLQSQSKYLQDYINNIARMRELGFSADVLAMVSDGSAQSADYAAELATAGKTQVEQINSQVADVKAKTAELSTSLTENKLAVDEGLNGLTADWAAAMAELNKYSDAKGNVAQTMQGIIDGLSENAGTVQQQVNSILAMLSSLSGASYGVSIPGVNIDVPGSASSGSTIQVNTQLNMDGHAVASAVSTHQASSLRNMERSGVTFN